MDGISFRKALKSLNLPLCKAAEFLGVSNATVRNWANDRARIPQPVSMLLGLMLALKLDPPKVNEWLEDQMNQWPETPEERLIDAIVRWLGERGHVVHAATGIPGLYHIDGGPELTTNQVISFYRQKIGLQP